MKNTQNKRIYLKGYQLYLSIIKHMNLSALAFIIYAATAGIGVILIETVKSLTQNNFPSIFIFLAPLAPLISLFVLHILYSNGVDLWRTFPELNALLEIKQSIENEACHVEHIKHNINQKKQEKKELTKKDQKLETYVEQIQSLDDLYDAIDDLNNAFQPSIEGLYYERNMSLIILHLCSNPHIKKRLSALNEIHKNNNTLADGDPQTLAAFMKPFNYVEKALKDRHNPDVYKSWCKTLHLEPLMYHAHNDKYNIKSTKNVSVNDIMTSVIAKEEE